MISSIEGYHYYQEMLQYISARLHRPVYLIQRKTYHEINELLRSGDVAAGFICSGAYILDAEKSGIEILVVPYAQGTPYYRAYVITGTGTPCKSLKDLRGRSFAFTDPLSLTGHYYVLFQLKEWGEPAESFFSKVIYSGSHDNSIRAVAFGEIDAASVDSLIYEYMRLHQVKEIAQTRIIERSEPLGIPPFVVSPHLDTQTRDTLKMILLTMDDDPEGQVILKNLGLDGFYPLPKEDIYAHVRQILKYFKK